jgi:hypothetical protein
VPLPTFVIVGAQKSGTTTLHDWLGQVARVWVSSPKELHYFDRPGKRGPAWYPKQFHPGPDDVAWGESTPIYLYRDDARAAMAQNLPDAKFIAILREPVSRAYSHYWFARRKGAEELDSFAAAVAAEPARLASRSDRQPALGSYLDRGRYLHQLTDLADRVGRDRIQVHLTDDLRREPIEVLRRTCAFIGVPWADLSNVVLEPKNTFAARLVNGARPPRQAQPTPGPAEDAYPPIDPALRQSLREEFADDNAQLAEWIGRDLTDWS